MKNSQIYEKNIDAIKNRYPSVVKCLDNEMEDNSGIIDIDDIRLLIENDRNIITVNRNNRLFKLNSRYNDKSITELWYDSLGEKWGLNAKLFMYGFGTGVYVREFLKSHRSDTKIIVFEPSKMIFRLVLENFDVSDILSSDSVKFVFGPLLNDITLKAYYESLLVYEDMMTIKACSYPNYNNIFSDNYELYCEALEGAQRFVVTNQIVQDRFGLNNNQNFFHITKYYFGESYCLEDLRDVVKGKNIAAIIVAAGPSLDKNIDKLKKAKGKSIIIATDTSARPLYNNGIIPDVIITMDGKKDARYLAVEESRYAPLIAHNTSGKDLLDCHKGKKFFFADERSGLISLCADLGAKVPHLVTGGSVANLSFSFARYLGCDTLILVGQDLAYTEDKTHSGDTVRGEVGTKQEELEHVVWDIDIYGNAVRSSAEFKMYKEWFEKQITIAKNLEAIDATEGGVFIQGTKLMALEEVIEEKCTVEYDFAEAINSAHFLFDDEQKKKFNDYFVSVPDKLESLEELVDESIDYYEKMKKIINLNNYQSKEMQRIYRKCCKNTELIDNSEVMEYVNNQLQDRQSKLKRNINVIEDEEKSELLATCEIGEEYLKDMKDSIEELLQIIKET